MSTEEMEDLLDEIGDGMAGGRRSPRRRGGSGWMGPAHKEVKRSTPESRIEAKLAKFEPQEKADENTKERLKQEKEVYLEWVNRSLENKREYIMNDSDLVVTHLKDGLINVRHTKSGFYAHGVGEKVEDNIKFIYARSALLNVLEKHLEDWRQVSPDFREKHGVTLKPKISNVS